VRHLLQCSEYSVCLTEYKYALNTNLTLNGDFSCTASAGVYL
jgi:hypothetical protein